MKRTGRKALTIDIDKLEELASQGLNNIQIAQSLGMVERTLYKHRKKTPAVEEALIRGRDKSIETVTHRLYGLAMSGNAEACIFFLNVKIGWEHFEGIGNTHMQRLTKLAENVPDYY